MSATVMSATVENPPLVVPAGSTARPAGGGGAAVQVSNVSKLFHRGERHDSLRDLIPSMVRRLRGRTAPAGPGPGADTFYAVRDLNFDVEFGRALGIIGPNGAGKSTTLKLLTGILRPTTGEIRMRGRVASLIEVSAGFHQDLTGRENVYLQGAIMGLTRREVGQRLASIVDFSGIEAFIDTPVKRYSSGMNARLGFSIAVHLEPDVLVIDEVLSVGDMAFQAKCVERMKAFKRDGVAIVFVSHNMQAVGELCDEALVVKGTPRFRGNVGDAVQCYLDLSNDGQASLMGDGVSASNVRLTDASGAEVHAVEPHTPLAVHADIHVAREFRELIFGLRIRRATDGMQVFDCGYTAAELGFDRVEAGQTVRLRYDHRAHLARGQYTYEVNVYDVAETRHRLHVSAGGVRVDEYRTHSAVADVEGTMRATAVAPGGTNGTNSTGGGSPA